MIDSREKLALSCTFALRNGTLESLDPVDAAASRLVDLAAGLVLDSKYEILGLLGQGGMGAVYKVRHLLLQKDMALKTFRSHSLSAESWQRFQLEARAIARLKHKNIVEVFDFGIAQNELPYYTMELLEGESLAELLAREQRLAPAEALQIFLQAAEALAHAHRQQIVHRDIKPANIFLQKGSGGWPGSKYRPKLVDFGIAKLVEDASANAFSDAPGSRQALTQSGVIFGSPLYMSPEQSLGQSVDSRTDIYSFGCALYETLVGAPPFLEDSAMLTLMSHQTKTPRRLTDALPELRLPQRLDSMMARLLAKNAEKRYQTFEDVTAELRYCLEAVQVPAPNENAHQVADEEAAPGKSARKRPMIVALCAIAALLVGCAAGYYFYNQVRIAHGRSAAAASVPVSGLIGDQVSKGQTMGFPYSKDRVQLLAGMKPFLIETTATKRIFLFPELSIGKLRGGFQAKAKAAEKRVEVSKQEHLYFFAGDECCKTPALFKRFGPGDLFYLQLDTLYDGEWRNHHVAELVGLSSLHELNLSGLPYVDRAAIPDISRLPGLHSLDVSRSAIDGRGVAELKTLPQLFKLKMNESINLRPLFRSAASSHCDYRMQDLELKSSHVEDSDLEGIAAFKHLRGLLLSDNNIKGSGLKYLTRLGELQILILDGNGLSPSSLDAFVQMRSLQRLEIDAGIFTAAQIQRLKRALPNCKIIESPVAAAKPRSQYED